MSNNACRLRKYKRKKDAAFKRGHGYDRLIILYYRYFHKIYGKHQLLWEKP